MVMTAGWAAGCDAAAVEGSDAAELLPLPAGTEAADEAGGDWAGEEEPHAASTAVLATPVTARQIRRLLIRRAVLPVSPCWSGLVIGAPARRATRGASDAVAGIRLAGRFGWWCGTGRSRRCPAGRAVCMRVTGSPL